MSIANLKPRPVLKVDREPGCPIEQATGAPREHKKGDHIPRTLDQLEILVRERLDDNEEPGA